MDSQAVTLLADAAAWLTYGQSGTETNKLCSKQPLGDLLWNVMTSFIMTCLDLLSGQADWKIGLSSSSLK